MSNLENTGVEKGIFTGEFSFRSREKALKRFRDEIFDILIIGGGITGAAVARDAATRGLKVALVERNDFAFGTSSRSSKLIHGGLRYLENFEFGLVFEALAERTLLLKTVPQMVRPLPFYMPVYEGDSHGKGLLGLGLWFYDVLALFRSPGFHKTLSKKQMLSEIPLLKEEGLKGGFRYFDASMWDDVLAVETLRSAQSSGAAVANYIEALSPIWQDERICGFHVHDRESSNGHSQWNLRAHKTIVCAGPWTDELGARISDQWHPWLSPSKGVHLVFDLKKIPVPGAMVMSHPKDGRVAFVMPRPDLGAGITIVGTTDGPTSKDPNRAQVAPEDVQYLFDLLSKYFPNLKLENSDIISAYVGVRPLMGDTPGQGGGAHPDDPKATVLQKVSREHHIDQGPGGTVVVAGGKYTTHRKMAEEIVDFTLKDWKEQSQQADTPNFPLSLKKPKTKVPINPSATSEAVQRSRVMAEKKGLQIPKQLMDRYGAEALTVMDLGAKFHDSERLTETGSNIGDPEGFPALAAQLRFAIRSEMVIHLEDFYFRRLPLYTSRKDHGKPWAFILAQVWAQERGLSEAEVQKELKRLDQEIKLRSAWQDQLS